MTKPRKIALVLTALFGTFVISYHVRAADESNSGPASDQGAEHADVQADAEKAWACKPIIVSETRPFVSIADTSPECVRNSARYQALIAARYSMEYDATSYLEDWIRRADLDGFKAERDKRSATLSARERRTWLSLDIAEKLLVRKAAIIEKERKSAERLKQLRSGAKIASMEDASLFHSPEKLLPLISQPELRPRGRLVAGTVVIDGESGGMIRAIGHRDFAGTTYVFLKASRKATWFGTESPRIGQRIHVLGRYSGNAKYRTVLGEERTAPVVDLMYWGPPAE